MRMRSIDSRLAGALAVLVFGGWSAAVFGAQIAPVAVSPGTDRGAGIAISDRCPTFSWSGVEGAVSYELTLYRVGEGGLGARPIFTERIAASAFSWTPSLAGCLDAGDRYAWSVRAALEKGYSEWSEPSLFQVVASPGTDRDGPRLSPGAVSLSSELEDDAAVDSPVEPGAGRSSDEPPPQGVAQAGTQLSVDGNVDADSFSGDGSGLTGVDAELLDGLDSTSLVRKAEIDSEADLEGLLADVTDVLTDGETAAAATALAADGANCPAGQLAAGVDPAGNAQGCAPVEWADLANRPAGLDDGDDDTIYTAGGGLELDGTVFSLEAFDEQILSTADPDGGEYSSIAIGADGLPVISHRRFGVGLKVTKCNDVACSGNDEKTSIVYSSSVAGEYNSIAIGADGYPVISFYEPIPPSSGRLRVVKCNDLACDPDPAANGPETVSTVDDAVTNVGEYTSIALGADGNPVISYFAATGVDLKVAKCNDPACDPGPAANGPETLSIVDGNGIHPLGRGQWTSIAVPADGLPVVSYWNRNDGELWVAKCNDPACDPDPGANGPETLSMVDDAGNSGLYTSIAIGADGFPVISYYDEVKDDLRVAKCNDAACSGGDETVTILDSAGQVGLDSSITLAADGLPVVSYVKVDFPSSLKVAKCNDPACSGGDESLSTVDSGDISGATSIALGADDLPVVSYRKNTAQDLKVARCSGSRCIPGLGHGGNLDAASFSGEGSALTNLDPVNLAAGTAGIDISGTAATAAALGADGANCPAGEFAAGVDATGTAQGCAVPADAHAVATRNTRVGDGALSNVTTGVSNTATGHKALEGNTDGDLNTAVGSYALYSSTGIGNTATGARALRYNSTGASNTALGVLALYSNTTGSANTAAGDNALFASTGSRNTALGQRAGYHVTTGSDNVFIANEGVAGDSETIKIGTQGTQAMTYLAGIEGTSLNGSPVVVTTAGQLGTAAGALATDVTGNAATATALAADGTDCPAGEFAAGVDASGAAQGCAVPADVHAFATFNTRLGESALAVNTTGSWNTAGGAYALTANGTGAFNTAVGAEALRTNTTGNDNTAVGGRALTSNDVGVGNTAVGSRALYSNTSGLSNTASGHKALYSNTSGIGNVATGYDALRSSTTGGYNVASGFSALRNNTAGFHNVAVGTFALKDSTTASGNVAVGDEALRDNTLGDSNVAVGRGALINNTEGDDNVAVGRSALHANDTGAYNVAVGKKALWFAEGSYNIAIGHRAGYEVGRGPSAGGDHNILIGNEGFSTADKVIRIGTPGLQVSTKVAGIRGVTTSVNDAINVLIDSNGQLGTVNSSRRYKEEITDMGSASERLLELRPVTFRYRKELADGERPIQYGLIAEDVAEVFPELAVYDDEGRPETVKYRLLSTLLLNELQKLAGRSDEQAALLEVQAGELASLRSQVGRLASLEARVRELEPLLTRLERVEVVLDSSPGLALGGQQNPPPRSAHKPSTN